MKEQWTFTLMTSPSDWRLFENRSAPRVSEWRFLCFCLRWEMKP